MPLFKKANSTTMHSRLVAQQDWDGFRKVLSSKRGQQEVRTEMSALGVDGALHFVCRFHPPLDVVKSLAEVFPGSVTHADATGRYPMHIAAKWGASPHVIRFLAEQRPEVAGLQDNTGKTPLHHFCLSYRKNYSQSKNEGIPINAAMLEIVKGLCKSSPSTVNLEDEEDMTAVEYAIFSDISLKALRSLQKACEKDWKERRRQSSGSSHADVEENLLAESRLNSERLTKELMELSRSAMEKSMSSLKAGESKLPSVLSRLPTVRSQKANTSRAFAA